MLIQRLVIRIESSEDLSSSFEYELAPTVQRWFYKKSEQINSWKSTATEPQNSTKFSKPSTGTKYAIDSDHSYIECSGIFLHITTIGQYCSCCARYGEAYSLAFDG